MFVFAIIAILTYLLSLGLIIPSLLRNSSVLRAFALISASIALICHTIALQQRIFDTVSGQNLSVLNVASCVSLIIGVIMTVVAARSRGWFLLPIVYSFAIINLSLASLMPGEFITHLENAPTLLIHIALALFSYATLMIATLYALQLAWVDYQLKHKRFSFTINVPPLMSIERKMFHITQVGLIFLTCTLITGFMFFDNLLAKENIQKTVLSIISWVIYVTLLLGHYRQGWRGRAVVWFSFAGALMLTLAYFGSRFIQENLLR